MYRDVLDITSKQVEMLACKPRLEAASEVEVVVVLVTPVRTVILTRKAKYTQARGIHKICAMRRQG